MCTAWIWLFLVIHIIKYAAGSSICLKEVQVCNQLFLCNFEEYLSRNYELFIPLSYRKMFSVRKICEVMYGFDSKPQSYDIVS